MYPTELADSLAPFSETGKLNIMYLKRYWGKALLKRANNLPADISHNEWQLDKTLLFTLGVGLEQTMKYIFSTAPTFDEFEEWIIKTAGEPDQLKVERFNQLLNGEDVSRGAVPDVLTKEDLQFFERNGYLIIKNAIPKTDCDDTIEVICKYIGVERNNPASWYNYNADRQGIMVQLFQNDLLEKNRQSIKIRQVFEQLYNRTDLWVTTDRVGFNPPETANWKFSGPFMHWDVSLQLPIPFRLQGLLYLADTAENQGAFTLVPGFQHRIAHWLANLPEGADPRSQDIDALGSTPIAAIAGDFIVWMQALPHGSRPNTADKPRFVQYITYEPAHNSYVSNWI